MKSNEDKDNLLSIKEYLDEIRLYFCDIINDQKIQDDIINVHKTKDEWKIQLTIAINFLPSKYTGETRTIHSKSDNIEILIDW